MASWHPATMGKYDTYFREWTLFCSQNSFPVHRATVSQGLQFVTQLLSAGKSYSSINGARSALSAFIPADGQVTFGQQPLVSKFVKGVANLRPPMAKYACMWEAKTVLDKLRALPSDTDLTLIELTLKVVMLLALTLCQCAQAIQTLVLSHVTMISDGAQIGFPTKLKQTRPGFHLKPLLLKSYPLEPKICPVTTLKSYISRTSSLRHGEPHKPHPTT